MQPSPTRNTNEIVPLALRKKLDAQRVSRDLTNLGYKVGNITNAFTSLITRKPAYVVQLKKSGSNKLTTAGIQAVNDVTVAGESE